MSTKTDNETTSSDTESRNMSTDTESRNMSTDTENKNMSTDTMPRSSSAVTETDHLFFETESKHASRETKIDNPLVDTECTDTPDTLTLARLDSENQGTLEAEYSYGGEVDLHRHYANCTKNPGHKNFIPVDKFSIEDLPEGYRDKDVMDYIRAMSDLTVRVTSKYVSDKRPETVGVGGKTFPGYFYRGQRRTTVGTGWVDNVDVIHEKEHETCRCKDCLTSSKPQREFGILLIRTAGHVVYDESEAAHTTCHLYFDRGSTPETCDGVIALTGMFHFISDQKTDVCRMIHFTHDLDLSHRLYQTCKRIQDLLTKIQEKPYKWDLRWRQPALDKQPMSFIMSHPHGCSKQISIGCCLSLLALPYKRRGYTYTAATCPGSSGSAVHILNAPAQYNWCGFLSTTPSLHHGVCDKHPGMNLSLLNPEWLFPEMVSLVLQLLDEEGPWEDICYAEDEDLRKHYHTCQNNPGHHNFFPVDKFSVDHLPPCTCNDEIMELIKVLSDITVRVSVRYVSEKRRETVDCTDIPYPWYRHRGSNQLRLGSGRITKVEFSDDEVCDCKECKNSDTPAKLEVSRIHIDTAAHLVYDDLEGKQTTCHLFFYSDETPDACKDVVTFTNARCTEINMFEDSCKLVYCTHDLTLAHKLEESVRLYEDLKRQCYSSYNHETVKQNDIKNLTPNPPLNIVVSHPHGRAKYVSISYPGCHGNTDTEETQRPYSSITCPGCSGAPLIALGYQPLYLRFE